MAEHHKDVARNKIQKNLGCPVPTLHLTICGKILRNFDLSYLYY